MENFLFILKFFGGIILLLAIVWLIGHLLKLDKVYEEMQNGIDNKKLKP
jgi:hypothetical protein